MNFSMLNLLGGFSFFFFGLSYARQGLQFVAGDRMRSILARFTRNRFLGFGVGAFITLLLQSSTATILMLMSLAATGLLTLTQAMGIILGADIGTTLVVILLSIRKVSHFALLFVIFGFILEWLFKEPRQVRFFGRILFGFGLVFFGMKLMTEAASPLAMNPETKTLFAIFAHHPFLLLFVSILLTIAIQTSAATIGIAIALSLSGILTLPMALPIVLGANIGTCFTTFIASVNSNSNGKRVAMAHLFSKTFGVALVLPFMNPIVSFIEAVAEFLHQIFPIIQVTVAGEIAVMHLLFNVALAFVFLPILPLGVWFVLKIVPETKVGKFGPQYLDVKALETPALAFAQAKQELLRIAALCHDLYRDCLRMFEANEGGERTLHAIEERDDRIDLLEKEVRFYLAKISKETLTEGQSTQEMALIAIGADLEGMGDIISKELLRLARKKIETKRIFSEAGWQDIQTLHQMGLQISELVTATFTAPSEELVRKVEHQVEEFYRLEQRLREAHIERLHAKKPEAFETSSIHLDLLSNLRRICDHLVHLARMTLQT